METTDKLLDIEKWRDTLSKILQYYANIPYRYGDVKTFVIISQDRNHFMLLHEGWQNVVMFMVLLFMPKSAMSTFGFITMVLRMGLRTNLWQREYPRRGLYLLFILPMFVSIPGMELDSGTQKSKVRSLKFEVRANL